MTSVFVKSPSPCQTHNRLPTGHGCSLAIYAYVHSYRSTYVHTYVGMLLVMYEQLSLNADSLCRTNVTCLSTLDPVLTSVNQAPSWRSVIGHHRCPALAELYTVGTVVRCDQWCLSLYSGIYVNCMESIASDHFRSITAGACFDFFCVHKVSLLENMCVCIYVLMYQLLIHP